MLLFLFANLSHSQYGALTKEQRILYTQKNPYDRFEDGRPRVPDDILARMKTVTIEEAWSVLRSRGYRDQFEGGWMNLHPERVVVGRAVTASFVPKRPDLDETTNALGKNDGRIGAQNSWIIDTLLENDVIVVDLFGKVKNGTYAGDNLATSIHTRSKTGMIIDGGIRDLDGIYELPDFNAFVRGVDPTGIADVTLMGINIPIRIGPVTVMPGDVVLGRRGGVIFIPPHLAQEVVESAEDTQRRDTFGKQRLREGKYTPGEIDRRWTDEIENDFQQWLKERNK
ncbi:MAG: RraA family protein [Candidatus Omnitrophota bacterium]|jgi:regulator of RNase E activity RraA|nr:MAG: RraA family protein [Candidatus Omnitrophota bacterium]